jgi:hypothetical protein
MAGVHDPGVPGGEKEGGTQEAQAVLNVLAISSPARYPLYKSPLDYINLKQLASPHWGESLSFAILIAQQQGVHIMAGAEAKKLSSAIEDDPKIVAGALEGLAEHRAGKGKSFDNVDDLKSYLEKT